MDLYYTVERNNVEYAAKLIQDQSYNVNFTTENGKHTIDSSSFIRACLLGRVEIVRLLLKRKDIDVNWSDSNGDRALSLSSNTEVVKMLLDDQRVDVNFRNNRLQTSFVRACDGGLKEVAKLLLGDPRVDVNLQDKDGYTAFYCACMWGRLEMVKLLIQDNRVNVNLADNSESTPFLHACLNGNFDIVKFLLNHPRINVNLADDHGWSPLMWCCVDYGELVQDLINCPKVDLFIKTTKEYGIYDGTVYGPGSIALDVERGSGYTEIIEDEMNRRKRGIVKFCLIKKNI
jgi:hypothetical protein